MTVSLYIHTYTRFSDYFSFVVVQSLSCVWLLVTPWFPCPSLSPRVCSHSCPLSQWCRLAISSSATLLCPLVFPISGSFSMSWLFASGSHTLCSFSFSISPPSEYSGLISFRIDWFDLLAVQGTLKNLLQQHSSKVSILWCSAFYGPTLTSIHDYWKSHSFD